MSTETEHSNSQIVHTDTYPAFDDMDLIRYPRVDGMQSLGFVQRHRPDIHIVTDRTESAADPDQIIPEINQGLAAGKKVGLFFWDEDLIMPNHHTERLLKTLEPYAEEPVYLCSNMDGECLLTYSETAGWPIRVIHVPWLSLNIVSNYQAILMRSELYGSNDLQYACYINRPDWHKQMLRDLLLAKGLDRIGDIRYDNQQFGAGDPQPCLYYQQQDRLDWTSSHDMKRSLIYDHQNQIWMCHLARNLSRIQQMLKDIPLVIQPESNLGLFPMTEKSLWPIVLGRLVLIQARPRFMSWFQDYVGFDFSGYINLEYDTMDGWNEKQQRERTECMLNSNLYLIRHAREIWREMRHDLDALAQALPHRIYRHFCAGLDQLR